MKAQVYTVRPYNWLYIGVNLFDNKNNFLKGKSVRIEKDWENQIKNLSLQLKEEFKLPKLEVFDKENNTTYNF